MIQLPTVPPLKSKTLFGICNALLDITAEVDQAYLDKYGLQSNNAILADEKTQNITQDMIKHFKVKYTAGGAGQNTMRAAQWQLPPFSTVYVSCVGKDVFADLLRQEAKADGVEVHYMEVAHQATGTCATLISHQGLHRSLVAHLGAALSMDVSFLKQHEHLLTESCIFYVTGFMMNVSLEAVLFIAEHALAHHKIFTLNLSAPFVSQFYGDALMQAYAFADIVFGNEAELHAFALLNGLSISDSALEETVQAIANLPKKYNQNFLSDIHQIGTNTSIMHSPRRSRVVVITQGADPILVSDGCQVLRVPVCPIPENELVDTNGAGDAFTGGFLAAFIQGKNIHDCITLGNHVAAHILRTSGIVFPRNQQNHV